MHVRYIDFSKFKYAFQLEKVLLHFPLMSRIGVPEAREVFVSWLKKTYPDGLSVGQINAILRVTHEYNTVNEAWLENQQYYKDRNDFLDHAILKKARAMVGWGKYEYTWLCINLKLLNEPLHSRPHDPNRKALSERYRLRRQRRRWLI